MTSGSSPMIAPHTPCFPFFFFNDTATTEIYTLSLHDALPIFTLVSGSGRVSGPGRDRRLRRPPRAVAGSHGRASAHRLQDRKSTRLNSSHDQISYAVFCLKKKKHRRTGSSGSYPAN